MKWIKTHKSLTFMVLSFVLSLGFSLIFFADSSYAASQSFDFTSNPGRNYVFWDSSNNSLGFTPTFVKVENISTGTCSGSQQSFYGIISAFYYTNFSDSATAWLNSDCSFVLTMSLMPTLNSLKFMSYSFPVSFRLTLYDSDPTESQPCPSCPEIPETPYGDKLDKIYTAILVGSGTILFIYFMFCMYQMFFGGLKK